MHTQPRLGAPPSKLSGEGFVSWSVNPL